MELWGSNLCCSRVNCPMCFPIQVLRSRQYTQPEKAMAPHFRTPAWKIPWTGAWWAAVYGVTQSDTTERLHFHFSLSCTGEGNGNPLQCSCMENPRDWGAWWAAIYGVAQSWTGLKQPSSSSSNCTITDIRFNVGYIEEKRNLWHGVLNIMEG